MMNMSEHEITCNHCGYKWYTKSKLVHVSCPSCQGKVQNPYAELNPSINRPVHVKKEVVIV